MQASNAAELQTQIMRNSNDRMEIIMAHQIGAISFREMTLELKRLDDLLNVMLTDWAANHSVMVPVLPEDLVCENVIVLAENQYN